MFMSDEEDTEIKIGDFGFARYIGEGSIKNEECGTVAYIAPEIVKSVSYGKAVDMWSLGVILYIMLCGFPPFYDDDSDEILELVKLGKYNFPDPYWSKVSKEAKDLVSSLLQVDPTLRITADQALEHPWFFSPDTKAVMPTLDVPTNWKVSAEFKAALEIGNEIQRGNEIQIGNETQKGEDPSKKKKKEKKRDKSKKDGKEKKKIIVLN